MPAITTVRRDFATLVAQNQARYIQNQALEKDRELRAALTVQTNLQALNPHRQNIKEAAVQAVYAEQLDHQLFALYMRENLDTKGTLAPANFSSLSALDSAIRAYKEQAQAEEVHTNRRRTL